MPATFPSSKRWSASLRRRSQRPSTCSPRSPPPYRPEADRARRRGGRGVPRAGTGCTGTARHRARRSRAPRACRGGGPRSGDAVTGERPRRRARPRDARAVDVHGGRRRRSGRDLGGRVGARRAHRGVAAARRQPLGAHRPGGAAQGARPARRLPAPHRGAGRRRARRHRESAGAAAARRRCGRSRRRPRHRRRRHDRRRRRRRGVGSVGGTAARRSARRRTRRKRTSRHRSPARCGHTSVAASAGCGSSTGSDWAAASPTTWASARRRRRSPTSSIVPARTWSCVRCPSSTTGRPRPAASPRRWPSPSTMGQGATRANGDGAESAPAFATCDLVVTTYGLLTRDLDVLAAVDWTTVVLDEAQFVKNPATRAARAVRKLQRRAAHRPHRDAGRESAVRAVGDPRLGQPRHARIARALPPSLLQADRAR